MSNITITLNTFDESGVITGTSKEVSLSLEAIADIIDHAHQVAIVSELPDDENRFVDDVTFEMVEALQAYGIMDDQSPSDTPESGA